MMLTTKGRYAVMAIIDIATYGNEATPITLNEIANRQNIATSYLEQIFNKLKVASLVKSIKGPGGGYILNQDIKKCKIKNIIDAVEENLTMTRCGMDEKTCRINSKEKCTTHYLWEGLSLNIKNYLNEISISDLLSGKIKQQVLSLRNVNS